MKNFSLSLLCTLALLCSLRTAQAQGASSSVRANSATWIIDSQAGVGVSSVAEAAVFNPATLERARARSESGNGIGFARAKSEVLVQNTGIGSYIFANSGTYPGTLTPVPTAASFFADDLTITGSALGAETLQANVDLSGFFSASRTLGTLPGTTNGQASGRLDLTVEVSQGGAVIATGTGYAAFSQTGTLFIYGDNTGLLPSFIPTDAHFASTVTTLPFSVSTALPFSVLWTLESRASAFSYADATISATMDVSHTLSWTTGGSVFTGLSGGATINSAQAGIVANSFSLGATAPEPTTVVLLLAGTLVVVRRRRVG